MNKYDFHLFTIKKQLFFSIIYYIKNTSTANLVSRCLTNLIRIGKSAHTREDAKNIIINRVYANDTANG